MRRGRLGFWVRLAVLVLRPVLLGLTRRSWRGAERLPPTGGALVVANHISHFDPLALAHFVYDAGRVPRFLAKARLFTVPVVGRVLRGAGQIPVLRDSADAGLALAAAVVAVRRGECVVFYPEGTVTRDPGLWPMVGRTGAARVALATGAPVIPVAQWGAHRVLPPYRRLPRLIPRATMQLAAGVPVDLSDLAAGPVTREALSEATSRIMAAVTRQLEALRGEAAPPERLDPRREGLPTTGDPRAWRRRAGSR